MRMNTQIDVRDVLPTIQAPTLVLHRTRRSGRQASRRAAGSRPRFRARSSSSSPETTTSSGPATREAVVDEIEEFLTGVRAGREPDRVLATVLFTDIVGSTERATELGDRALARAARAPSRRSCAQQLERYHGREVDTAGDGFLATFDGPARAIRCAWRSSTGVRALGLEVRAGVHTGECELFGDKVAGHRRAHGRAGREPRGAGRGARLAAPSRTSSPAPGSSSRTAATHELKGVPGEWRLYAVSG